MAGRGGRNHQPQQERSALWLGAQRELAWPQRRESAPERSREVSRARGCLPQGNGAATRRVSAACGPLPRRQSQRTTGDSTARSEPEAATRVRCRQVGLHTWHVRSGAERKAQRPGLTRLQLSLTGKERPVRKSCLILAEGLSFSRRSETDGGITSCGCRTLSSPAVRPARKIQTERT